MTKLVRVEIPVAPETTSGQVKGDDPFIAVLLATRADARMAGLTDDEIDAELEAHRAERCC